MSTLYPVNNNNHYVTLHAINMLSSLERNAGVLLLKNDKEGNKFLCAGYSLRERFIIFLGNLPGFSNIEYVKKALEQITDAKLSAASTFLEMIKSVYDDKAYDKLCHHFNNRDLGTRRVEILAKDVQSLLILASRHTEQQQKTQAIYNDIEEKMQRAYPKFSLSDTGNSMLLRAGQKLSDTIIKMLESLQVPGARREQLKMCILDFISREALCAPRSISLFQKDFQHVMWGGGEVSENNICTVPGFQLETEEAMQVNGSSLGKTRLLESKVHNLTAKLAGSLSECEKESHLRGLYACHARAIMNETALKMNLLFREVNPELPQNILPAPVSIPLSPAIAPLPSSELFPASSMLPPPPPPPPPALTKNLSISMLVLPPSPPPPPPLPLEKNLLTTSLSKSMSSIPLTMAELEGQQGSLQPQMDFGAELQSRLSKRNPNALANIDILIKKNKENFQAKYGAMSLENALIDSLKEKIKIQKSLNTSDESSSRFSDESSSRFSDESVSPFSDGETSPFSDEKTSPVFFDAQDGHVREKNI